MIVFLLNEMLFVTLLGNCPFNLPRQITKLEMRVSFWPFCAFFNGFYNRATLEKFTSVKKWGGRGVSKVKIIPRRIKCSLPSVITSLSRAVKVPSCCSPSHHLDVSQSDSPTCLAGRNDDTQSVGRFVADSENISSPLL